LALKQSTDSLSIYIVKFEQVFYKACSQDWPDVNKISAFCNSLNSTICRQLAQQLNLSCKYTEFIYVVQQLAGCSFASSSSPSSSHLLSAWNSKPIDLSTVDIGTISLGLDPKPAPKAILLYSANPIACSVSLQHQEQYRILG
jgi:hypothetical protein